MSTRSFTRMATVTASTKRSPSMASGKRGARTENIASLVCTPLDPVSAELALRIGLETPHELLQTIVDAALDIVEGDELVVSGTDYPIKAVENWDWKGSDFRLLILEDLKN